MNIKRIYNLETIREVGEYKVPNWCDHDAFFDFIEMSELDYHRFHYEAAQKDERVKLELKAYCDVPTDLYVGELEYIAFSFDGKYVGLVIGVGKPWWWELHDKYITNLDAYYALKAYVTNMYVAHPENVIGETVDIEGLDGRYGTAIDKRLKYNLRKEEK